jgi:hypothetical protein
MFGNRALECVGMLMIGDAVLGLIEPRAHMALWRRGPKAWRDFITPFVQHPEMTRAAGAAELLAGIWLAREAYRREIPCPDGSSRRAGIFRGKVGTRREQPLAR